MTNVEKLEHPHTAGGNVKTAATLENSSAVPQNVERGIIPLAEFSNSPPRYLPKVNENILFAQKLVHGCAQQWHS